MGHGDLLAEFDRLQRQMQRFAQPATSIRGLGRSDFPALNMGSTAESFEIYVFAPGLDPATIDLSIERGVLNLSGERKYELPDDDRNTAIHINERFSGSFHRAMGLSEDADPKQVTAGKLNRSQPEPGLAGHSFYFWRQPGQVNSSPCNLYHHFNKPLPATDAYPGFPGTNIRPGIQSSE